MTTEHEGYRDRLIGGCPDCGAYAEVVTPVGEGTTITIFHDTTCPSSEGDYLDPEGRKVCHAIKPDVLPYWPEQ